MSFSIAILVHQDDLGRILADDDKLTPAVIGAMGDGEGDEVDYVYHIDRNLGDTGWCRICIGMSDVYRPSEFASDSPIRLAMQDATHPYLVEMCHWESDGYITLGDASDSLLCTEDAQPLHLLNSILFRGINDGYDADEEIGVGTREELELLLLNGYEVYVEPSDTKEDELVAILADGWRPSRK